MRTKTLHVRLNQNATPPVTIVEDSEAVGKHRYELRWIPDTGQSGWVFTGITQPDQTSALPDPPFSPPVITDALITVADDNKHGEDHGTFAYSISVLSNGKTYWSDPEIINRGGN